MKREEVILVDEQNRTIGTMEKMEVHQKGLLHRAISVFIFDSDGRLLLQQRATHKYHSAGLWTNSCCSHPAPGENSMDAAQRRLQEEMGMETPLIFAFSFHYRAEFDNGLVEHEWDDVFIGHSNLDPTLNPEEAADFRWADLSAIEQEVQANPDRFTEWFKLIYKRAFERW